MSLANNEEGVVDSFSLFGMDVEEGFVDKGLGVTNKEVNNIDKEGEEDVDEEDEEDEEFNADDEEEEVDDCDDEEVEDADDEEGEDSCTCW